MVASVLWLREVAALVSCRHSGQTDPVVRGRGSKVPHYRRRDTVWEQDHGREPGRDQAWHEALDRAKTTILEKPSLAHIATRLLAAENPFPPSMDGRFRCAVHRAEHVSDIAVRELESEETVRTTGQKLQEAAPTIPRTTRL